MALTPVDGDFDDVKGVKPFVGIRSIYCCQRWMLTLFSIRQRTAHSEHFRRLIAGGRHRDAKQVRNN